MMAASQPCNPGRPSGPRDPGPPSSADPVVAGALPRRTAWLAAPATQTLRTCPGPAAGWAARDCAGGRPGTVLVRASAVPLA